MKPNYEVQAGDSTLTFERIGEARQAARRHQTVVWKVTGDVNDVVYNPAQEAGRQRRS